MLEELKIEEAVKAMLQGMQGMGANYAATTARTKEGDFRAQVIITTDEGTGIALDLLHDAIDEAPEGTDPLSAMLAAPALLAACKAAGDTLEALGAERSPEGVKVLAMVDAAVAQATGGEAAKEGEGRDDRAYAARVIAKLCLKVERLRDRLQTVVDEQVSPHETLPAEELIALLEHSLAEGRHERERLRGALESLSAAEQHYRRMHDRHGSDSPDTGRAWDLMRRAGTAARAALAGELDAAELCGSVLDRKGISRKRFRIWERINEYAEACGGDTSPTTVSDRRMRAVVAVESALDAALAGEASGDGEAKACGKRSVGGYICTRQAGHGGPHHYHCVVWGVEAPEKARET